MKKKVCAFILCGMAGLSLSGCGLLPKEEELPTAPILVEVETEEYTVAKVARGDVRITEIVRANYVPSASEKLAFRVGDEVVEKVYVQMGDVVKAGDVLAELDVSRQKDQLRQQQDRIDSLYLQLESMRLGNRFSYKIDVDSEIDAKNIEIAPLIVQPFVENAIIHGLVPKKDNCFLSIRFSKISNDKLLCVIEDNGVGRKHSEMMKQERGSSHKSYGMSITKRRLETLTKISNDDFSVEIVDLYDDNGNAAGTRVNIIISFYD